MDLSLPTEPSPGQIHSSLLRMVQAAQRLPEQYRALFRAVYHDGKSVEQACGELGLTPEQFETQHRDMLRTLRTAAA